ncbi:glycosyltransferase [Roseobacter weihaiensis]|uniref:glycosyltransferase n=1 Tax=Roseobacter weihaiensis TaxID=2763262 RepID=UPI001D0AB4E3|nr:nucleotide disphospho-sugar-binding domain-containing protein [Roseobacter sp. H9]
MYAYLHSVKDKDRHIMEALVNSGYHIDLHCDGVDISPADGISCLNQPLGLSEVFEGYSLVLHQAGLGLSTGCLLSGMPQLLVPKHVEAHMTAARLEEHGFGTVLSHSQQGVETQLQAALEYFFDPTAAKARQRNAKRARSWVNARNWTSQITGILAQASSP